MWSALMCRAQQTERFKSTFIADDPKSRKKARLSWYHPDDTVCPLPYHSSCEYIHQMLYQFHIDQAIWRQQLV